MAGNPQAAHERREAARHLVQHPLTCAEHDPDIFRLIRRHETELDRWFTQRLGYRLHVDSDTARLFKTGTVVDHRPLRTAGDRPLNQLEQVVLALVLASTAAGPAVTSLRDLVGHIRSAAVEADIALPGDAIERRAVVTVLRWMIDHGLAAEMHAHVDAYAGDEAADAVLKVRPDRIVLLPLPTLSGTENPDELVARGERRDQTRQWLRRRLVEDPVLYRDDLSAEEWGELRRRLGEEERLLDEMFGLVLESRAEGVATVDPPGTLAARRFPGTGTERHAALLLLAELGSSSTGARSDGSAAAETEGAPAGGVWTWDEIVSRVVTLTEQNARRWANGMVAAPEKLARRVMDLLVELRLVEWVESVESGDEGDVAGRAIEGAVTPRRARLLPAAARFLPVAAVKPQEEQAQLW